MKFASVVIAAAVVLVAVETCQAAGARSPEVGVGSRPSRHAAKRQPLEITVYRRRRVGGYSYAPSDLAGTYGRSPAPWMDVKQSPGGPFDSGFFFDSGIGPHGGNSPYFH